MIQPPNAELPRDGEATTTDERWRVLLDSPEASDADVLEGLALMYEMKAAANARQSPELVGDLPERQRHTADVLRRALARLSPPREGAGTTQREDGVSLIAAERRRQMEQEGWTPSHDDEHDGGELARAAEAYLFRYDEGADSTIPGMWPGGWHHRWWKPSADPIRNLVKAGALIAAEIDRLQRAATRLAS